MFGCIEYGFIDNHGQKWPGLSCRPRLVWTMCQQPRLNSISGGGCVSYSKAARSKLDQYLLAQVATRSRRWAARMITMYTKNNIKRTFDVPLEELQLSKPRQFILKVLCAFTINKLIRLLLRIWYMSSYVGGAMLQYCPILTTNSAYTASHMHILYAYLNRILGGL